MDDRANALLKVLIERYIADGQPVGSRTLSTIVDFSPATIRNVMAELEGLRQGLGQLLTLVITRS